MPKSLLRIADPQPVLHVLTADLAFTTVVQPLTLALPCAGAYEFDATLCFDNATLVGTRTTTITITISGTPVRVGIQRNVWRSPSTIGTMQLMQTTPSASVTISTGFNAMRSRFQAVGLIEVSAPTTVGVTVAMDAETNNLRAGSFAHAQLRSILDGN